MPADPAAPLWAQIAFLIGAPPAMAWVFRFMARGWAMSVQGGGVSDRTARRQRAEFWIVLWICYAVVAFIFVSSWLGFKP